MDVRARGAKVALAATAAMVLALVGMNVFDAAWLGLVVAVLLFVALTAAAFARYGQWAAYVAVPAVVIAVIGVLVALVED